MQLEGKLSFETQRFYHLTWNNAIIMADDCNEIAFAAWHIVAHSRFIFIQLIVNFQELITNKR